MTPRDVIGLWLDQVWTIPNNWGDDWRKVADDLLKRLDEQGLAVVPREPNEAMVDAVSDGGFYAYERIYRQYRAMLSAYSPDREK